jgi:hypothetical protein
METVFDPLLEIAHACLEIESRMRLRGCSQFGAREEFLRNKLSSTFDMRAYASWRTERAAEILTARLQSGTDAGGGGDGYRSDALDERRKAYAEGFPDPYLGFSDLLLHDSGWQVDFFSAASEWSRAAASEASAAFPHLAQLPPPRGQKLVELIAEVATSEGCRWLSTRRSARPLLPMFGASFSNLQLVATVQHVRSHPWSGLSLDWDVFTLPASIEVDPRVELRAVHRARRTWISGAFPDLLTYGSEHESAASVARSTQVLCWLIAECLGCLRSRGQL